jgi:hypothetical protein
VCDGVDQDCDGAADEGLPMRVLFADADGDGFGGVALTGLTCAPRGEAVVEIGGDCDDLRMDVRPGASEACDQVDQDCDGLVDEGIPTTQWYVDADADGYGALSAGPATCAPPSAGVSSAPGDCDDSRSDVRPGALESCDQTDQDCDGMVDDGLPTTQWYVDLDSDGYGALSAGPATCAPPSQDVSAVGGDCDDLRWDVHPGGVETCDDVDQDCDGAIDDGLPTTQWYRDLDMDGYGGVAVGAPDCAQPAGSVVDVDGDCDDSRDDVSPDGSETCDGVDENCDGRVDEGAYENVYVDYDRDGFGDNGSRTRQRCDLAGYSEDNGDCDDRNEDIHPDAYERCNAEDDDCDEEIDEGTTCGWDAARIEHDGWLFMSAGERKTFRIAREWCEDRGYRLWTPTLNDDRVIRLGTDTWGDDVWVGVANTCTSSTGARQWGMVVGTSCSPLSGTYVSTYGLDTTHLPLPLMADRFVYSAALSDDWVETTTATDRRDFVCMLDL